MQGWRHGRLCSTRWQAGVLDSSVRGSSPSLRAAQRQATVAVSALRLSFRTCNRRRSRAADAVDEVFGVRRALGLASRRPRERSLSARKTAGDGAQVRSALRGRDAVRLANRLRGRRVIAQRVEDRRERVLRRGPLVPVRLALEDHHRQRRVRLREHLYAGKDRGDAEGGLSVTVTPESDGRPTPGQFQKDSGGTSERRNARAAERGRDALERGEGGPGMPSTLWPWAAQSRSSRVSALGWGQARAHRA